MKHTAGCPACHNILIHLRECWKDDQNVLLVLPRGLPYGWFALFSRAAGPQDLQTSSGACRKCMQDCNRFGISPVTTPPSPHLWDTSQFCSNRRHLPTSTCPAHPLFQYPRVTGWGGWRCRWPLCWPKCVHGTCVAPDLCHCEPGVDGYRSYAATR